MEDRESASLLKSTSAHDSSSSSSSNGSTSSSRSLVPRIAIGGVLLGLLFLSLGFVSTYRPSQEVLVEDFPSTMQPAVTRAEERDLLSQVAIDLSPFNDTISNGISLEQVERVYCNFDQVRNFSLADPLLRGCK